LIFSAAFWMSFRVRNDVVKLAFIIIFLFIFLFAHLRKIDEGLIISGNFEFALVRWGVIEDAIFALTVSSSYFLSLRI
jgi:hypothetical protein